MANRKLEEKEIIHLSKQITELTELQQSLIAQDKEVNPFGILMISNNLKKAISGYKTELFSESGDKLI